MDRVLREAAIQYEKVNYYVEPLTEQKLRQLLEKMDAKPRDLLRTKEEIYKKLNLADPKHSDDELIKLMVQYPDLVQRPIVEKGSRAILARPADTIKSLL